jgi:hypothetical protein
MSGANGITAINSVKLRRSGQISPGIRRKSLPNSPSNRRRPQRLGIRMMQPNPRVRAAVRAGADAEDAAAVPQVNNAKVRLLRLG